MSETQDTITSRLWFEEAEDNNPFLAKKSYLHGYDVFGDLLQNASYVEYIFLLFTGHAATQTQSMLLEKIFIALANPGPRDHSVMAAMNSGVGGSGGAANLMAALAVGAGGLNGGREIKLCVEQWRVAECDLQKWQQEIQSFRNDEYADVWPVPEHCPGFEVYAETVRVQTRQLLEALCSVSEENSLHWLLENKSHFLKMAGAPISVVLVISAAFNVLGLTAQQAESIYLFARLPGAAAHALEQQKLGWKKFPFWPQGLKLTNDPAKE
jgi:citrate synthase